MDRSLELYKKMILTRLAEQNIQKYYYENDMKTPMHMSMGGEAITVGVCSAAGKNGHIFTSYRTHASYFSKTGETDNFFLEMYGKRNKISDGRAGSMHISSIEDGYILSSAIVGSHIPVSVGYAFANKIKNNGIISISFFGDGAIDEGVFWESVNLACLMKLPVLFVLEDNGFAVHTPSDKRHGYKSIGKIIEQFHCSVYSCLSTDVEEIYDVATLALHSIEVNKKPSFMITKYHRYLEHVGTKEDYNDGYRDMETYRKFLEVDPIKIQENRLLRNGLSQKYIDLIKDEISTQIDNSILKARQSDFCRPESIYEGVYNEND